MASNVQRACTTLPGFRQSYEKFCRELVLKQYAIGTVNGYSSKIAAISLYYGKLPEELSNDQIKDYLHHLLVSHPEASKSMFEHTIVGLRCYYKLLGFDSRLMSLPPIRSRKKLPKVLSQRETLALLSCGKDVRQKAILGMLYSCGIRVGELCRLRLEDIDRERMSVHIRQSKGGKDRYVPLSKNMVRVLQVYYKQYKPLNYLFCCSQSRVKQLSVKEVSDILHLARIGAGISKRVHCHMLRHSYATHLLEMGESILGVQLLLGHSQLKTTLVYLDIANLEDKRRFSPLDVLLENSHK